VKIKHLKIYFFVAILVSTFPVLAFSLPEGQTVVSGQASFNSTPNTLTINSSSDKTYSKLQ